MVRSQIFYGMVTELNKKDIAFFINKWGDDASFIRYSFPFNNPIADVKFYDDKSSTITPWNLQIKGNGKVGRNILKYLDVDIKTFIKKSDKNRFVIFENIHILAHKEISPSYFYEQLLAFCNSHILGNEINFILSSIKVPSVFEKDNILRHLWDFNDCNGYAKYFLEEPKQKELYGYLKNINSPL